MTVPGSPHQYKLLLHYLVNCKSRSFTQLFKKLTGTFLRHDVERHSWVCSVMGCLHDEANM